MVLWVIKRSVCDHSSPICPHNFPFHTLSLYFLCDMSYNSSHLRTNSINFSSISEDNQAGLIASKRSKRNGDDVILLTWSESSTSDTCRHVKQSRLGAATERNWDRTETLLSVWTSPFNYTWEKSYWTVTLRDGTETWRIVRIGPNVCFIRRRLQIWTMVISRWMCLKVRNVTDKSCGGSKHTFYGQYFFPENLDVYELVWKSVVEPGRPQMTV